MNKIQQFNNKFYKANIDISDLYISRMNNKFEFIEYITKNIKENGLKRPLVVKRINNKFEILLGGTRYWALKKLKYKKVPCVLISDKKETEYTRIKSYDELIKFANVKKLTYINGNISYIGNMNRYAML